MSITMSTLELLRFYSVDRKIKGSKQTTNNKATHNNEIRNYPPTSRKAASNRIVIDKITIVLPRKINLDRMD